MLTPEQNSFFTEILHNHTGRRAEIRSVVPVAGGSINKAFRIATGEGSYFIKFNDAMRYPGMFEAEARGLQLLRTAGAKVPQVIGQGTHGTSSYLLLEWLEPGNRSSTFASDFGSSLAALHRHTNDAFGLDHNNYIGSLPQTNQYHLKCGAFYATERLLPQIQLAAGKGLLSRTDVIAAEQLCGKLDSLFPEEAPALLHGDLWNGNYLLGPDGCAWLIDPAVYYGLRETDLAMTRLFGGFDRAFYDGYQETYPLAPGWKERTLLFQLYPLLVHANLFGASYVSSVREILKTYS